MEDDHLHARTAKPRSTSDPKHTHLIQSASVSCHTYKHSHSQSGVYPVFSLGTVLAYPLPFVYCGDCVMSQVMPGDPTETKRESMKVIRTQSVSGNPSQF